jgi:hypothetical protein
MRSGRRWQDPAADSRAGRQRRCAAETPLNKWGIIGGRRRRRKRRGIY